GGRGGFKAHGFELEDRAKRIKEQALAALKIAQAKASGDARLLKRARAKYAAKMQETVEDKQAVKAVEDAGSKNTPEGAARNWGLLGTLGLNDALAGVDDAARGPFLAYGLSGLMVGAALVFFAFLGFDSVSAHSEEAKNPQRDVPIGILASLVICTLLYAAV